MDALASLIALLKPQAIGAKIIQGAGRWGVRYPAFAQPCFALVLKGPCWLAVERMAPIVLEAGDFVLFPSMPGFTMASDAKIKPSAVHPAPNDQLVEEVFHGDKDSEPSVSMLGGYFTFDPVNAALLLDFLPKMLRIRASDAGRKPVDGSNNRLASSCFES